MRIPAGETHYRARLRAVDIPVIKRTYAEGATLEELAEQYQVHYTTLQKLVRGKNWRTLADNTPVPEGRRRWTKEERRYLATHPDLDAATVARHLHRTPMAVYVARAQLRKQQQHERETPTDA